MAVKDGKIDFHGREYKTVALRVHEFRVAFPIAEGWAIQTNIITAEGEVVVFRAAIIDPTGREVAVGFAEEVRSKRGINSTSALENCETSAIGRALAAAGYAGTEYASADELTSALNQQRAASSTSSSTPSGYRTHPTWKSEQGAFFEALELRGLTIAAVEAFTLERSWGTPAAWTPQERRAFIRDLDTGRAPELYTPRGPDVVIVLDEGVEP
jgi:hypothetical protein